MLSVVIAIYNAEDYLEKCLDSVVNQTYNDIEIICVNDGSSDNSKEIVKQYLSRDERIIFIDKKNEGPVLARRAGIERASGEYITFVDSDDWIDKNMYYEMMKAMVNNNADVVTSGFVREYDGYSVDSFEGIPKGIYRGKKFYKEYVAEIVGTDLFFRFNVTGSFGNKIFKTTRIKKYQRLVPETIVMGEDPAAVYPCLVDSETVVVMGDNYYHYRIRDDSITSSKTSFLDDGSLHILFDYMDDILKESYKKIPSLKLQIGLWKIYIVLSKWPSKIVKEENGNLFPYINVKRQDRIVLFGNGRFGKFLNDYLKSMGYNIVGICDNRKGKGILTREQLKRIDFDKIVVSVLRADEVEQIIYQLKEIGIKKSKIQKLDCKELKNYLVENNYSVKV